MRPLPAVLVLVALSASGCSRQDDRHPWVKPGMSRAEVLALVGTPVRVDSVFHQFDLDTGTMTTELLDSLRRSLDDSLVNKMILGRPVDHSYRSDAYVTWYYGPEIADTMFTVDRSSAGGPALSRVWFAMRKQRAVVLDTKTGHVKELGFRVLQVTQL